MVDSRAKKSQQHAKGTDSKGMVRFEDGSVSYRPAGDEQNRTTRRIIQQVVEKHTRQQRAIAQSAAGKNGGVMFNPNAKLDPSQVAFVRGIEEYPGQPQSRTPNFGTASEPHTTPGDHMPSTNDKPHTASAGGRGRTQA